MDDIKIIGKINIKAMHVASSQLVETMVSFEDRKDSIYYCWTFKDKTGSQIAGKCLSVYKSIIAHDEFEYVINHCRYSINNYRTDRDKMFEVIEIQNL